MSLARLMPRWGHSLINDGVAWQVLNLLERDKAK